MRKALNMIGKKMRGSRVEATPGLLHQAIKNDDVLLVQEMGQQIGFQDDFQKLLSFLLEYSLAQYYDVLTAEGYDYERITEMMELDDLPEMFGLCHVSSEDQQTFILAFNNKKSGSTLPVSRGIPDAGDDSQMVTLEKTLPELKNDIISTLKLVGSVRFNEFAHMLHKLQSYHLAVKKHGFKKVDLLLDTMSEVQKEVRDDITYVSLKQQENVSVDEKSVHPEYQIGDRILTIGMDSQQFNDKTGTVVRANETEFGVVAECRLAIKFDDEDLGIKAIKKINLKQMDLSPPILQDAPITEMKEKTLQELKRDIISTLNLVGSVRINNLARIFHKLQQYTLHVKKHGFKKVELLLNTMSEVQKEVHDDITYVSLKQQLSKIVPPSAHVYWDSSLVSEFSQYSKGSTAACTVMALECALRLQTGSNVDGILIQDVLNTGALYKSDLHTGLDEILPGVGRYRDALQIINSDSMAPYSQYSVRNIAQIIGETLSLVQRHKKSISVLLTKSPESVFYHIEYSDSGTFIPLFFDSHPRPDQRLTGAHFLFFSDPDSIINYLSKVLYPYTPIPGGGLQGEQLNTIEANFLSLKPTATIKPIDTEELRKEFQRIAKSKENVRQRSENQRRRRETERNEKKYPAPIHRLEKDTKSPKNEKSPSRSVITLQRQLKQRDKQIETLQTFTTNIMSENRDLKLKNQNLHRQLMASKSICRLFREGNCTRGASCWFSHDATPNKRPGPGKRHHLSGKKICQHFMEGNCRHGVRCWHSHDIPRPSRPDSEQKRDFSDLKTTAKQPINKKRPRKKKQKPNNSKNLEQKPDKDVKKPSPSEPEPSVDIQNADEATAKLIRELQEQDAKEQEKIFSEHRAALATASVDTLDDDYKLAQQLQREEQGGQERLISDAQLAQQLSHADDVSLAQRLADLENEHQERLITDAELAEQLEEKPIKCPICMEDCVREDVFIIQQCEHELHRECARPCITASMEINEYPVKCPICKANVSDPECKNGEISQTEALTVLSEDQQEKYIARSLLVAVNQSSSMQHCPTVDCPGVHYVEGDVSSYCMICEKVLCLSCGVEWHKESTCEEYQQWRNDNDLGERSFKQLAGEENWMNCPHCTVIVEKTMGCNHMQCRCGHHFCYTCGEQLPANDHYRHFNEPSSGCILFDREELDSD